MKHFGQILKKHIETNGLAKGEVASLAGITYNYLSGIFHKQSIDASLMERLCIASGLSPLLIFENVPIPQIGKTGTGMSAPIGTPQANPGVNEKLYQDLLAEKERYIKSLERQLEDLRGTKTEQNS